MDFSPAPGRHPAENLLPMINVVFLLLIFFLISAKLAPPEPFAVTLPAAGAAGGGVEPGFVLHLGADGGLGYGEARDDAALGALGAARAEYCASAGCSTAPPRLALRADAAAPAERLADLLASLAAIGFAEVTLVTADR